MKDFDIDEELNLLKVETKMSRQKRYGQSRLDKYKKQLIKLRMSGATIAELQRWLMHKRIKVEWSTVKRWFEKNG